MKKILLVSFVLMVFATWSFAAFSPTPLEISVQEEIIYPFNGTEVDFTVDVTGKPARCYLIINTRLPEEQLPHQVTNGFLGWHYVNRIDTTVYVSGAYNFSPGSNAITWDGKGSENTSGSYGGTYESSGNVEPGTYDYYVWAYDDQSPRQPACNFIAVSFYWQPQFTKFGEYDKAGFPLANPLIWGNVGGNSMYSNLHRAQDEDGNYLDEPVEGENSYGPPWGTAFKFPLGADPDDMGKLQTTFMPGFSQEAELGPCPITFDPFDQEYFYCFHVYGEQKMGALFKWHWVGDGNAETVDGWGGWDELLFDTATRKGIGLYIPEVQTDHEYIYIAAGGDNPYEIQWDVLYIVDFDGNKVISGQMLDDFYQPDNPDGVNTNGNVYLMYACKEYPKQVILGGVFTCTSEMVDVSRIIADEGNDEYVMWKNENGDYFQDNGWDPTVSDFPWNCNSSAYRTPNGGRIESYFFDSEGIPYCFKSYQGLNSFIVSTQDGSGIAYCKFADDTIASDKNKKGAGHRVDNGGQFDGLYIGDVVSDDIGYGAATQHIQWVGFDSAHGVIASEPAAVEEEGQAAFGVDAAYPNPANPTTTIGFTLAEAGHVTVDIYNVAGQKVNTLVDDEMSAGKHSVVWDGSGFSAGVYFYTVKSGNFSKTMKVTLLK